MRMPRKIQRPLLQSFGAVVDIGKRLLKGEDCAVRWEDLGVMEWEHHVLWLASWMDVILRCTTTVGLMEGT